MHQSYFTQVQNIFEPSDTFSIPNYLTTDYADARLWVLPDIFCAISALCDEHNVVHEDLKGCEENTGKMAMMDATNRIQELLKKFGVSGSTL